MQSGYRRPLRFEPLEDRRLLVADLEVFDINQAPQSLVGDTLVHNGKLYFLENHPEYGAELHALDLATNEISLVVDINPGRGDSMAGVFGTFLAVGDVIFFTAYDAANGYKLRAFDTSTNSLVSIDADNTGGSLNAGLEGPFAAVGDKVYFVGYDPVHGSRLRSFDTTTQSLHTFENLIADPADYFASANGKLYLFAGEEHTGIELGIVDSADDTYSIVDFRSGPLGATSNSRTGFALAENQLFFWTRTPIPQLQAYNVLDETYSTIDTLSAAFPMVDVPFMRAGEKLYFFGRPSTTPLGSLYSVDIATHTVERVNNSLQGVELREPQLMRHATVGDRLFVTGTDLAHGTELRIVEPTTNTFETLDLTPGPGTTSFATSLDLVTVDNTIYFIRRTATDRTLFALDTATLDVSEIVSIASAHPIGDPLSGPIVATGGALYFPARTSTDNLVLYGYEIASSEMTAVPLNGGTLSSTSNAKGFFTAGHKVLFAAFQLESGNELHVLDATTGLVEVVDVVPGVEWSSPGVTGWAQAGDEVFFTAGSPSSYGLYSYNLTTGEVSAIFGDAGTSPPDFLTPVGDFLYFVARDEAYGTELRAFNLVTRHIKTFDIRTGIAGSNPGPLTIVGGKLMFGADDPTYGEEWRFLDLASHAITTFDRTPGPGDTSLGTPFVLGAKAYFSGPAFSGELQVFDSVSGSVDSLGVIGAQPRFYTLIDGNLYLSARDDDGYELRILNTLNDTFVKIDLLPGLGSSSPGHEGGFKKVGDLIYFLGPGTEANGSSADHLYVLDPANNQIIHNIALEADLGMRLTGAGELIVIGDKLLFSAEDDTYGLEPRILDTADLSIDTIDINPGPESSDPWRSYDPLLLGDEVLIDAFDPTHGHELRLLDVTAHSWRTIDVNPGALSSNVSQLNQTAPPLVVYEERLYFRANRQVQGTELLAFDLKSAAAPVLPGDFNLDNTVDLADYTLWRNALGTEVPTYSGADGDGDGIITVADYEVWKSHYGQTYSPPAPLAALEAPSSEPVSKPELPSERSAPAPTAPPQLATPARRAPWSPAPRYALRLPSVGTPPDPSLLLWASPRSSQEARPSDTELANVDRENRWEEFSSSEPLELAFSEFGRDNE